jgi:hypothetical protein
MSMTRSLNGTTDVEIKATTFAPKPMLNAIDERVRQVVDGKLARFAASAKTGELYEWNKWMKLIPPLEFPPGWKVRIVPPCTGALVRFKVLHRTGDISVYLDGYGDLGHYGTKEEGGQEWVKNILQGQEPPDTDAEPYWEIYPVEGDTHRCGLQQTEELIRVIQEELDRQNN